MSHESAHSPGAVDSTALEAGIVTKRVRRVRSLPGAQAWCQTWMGLERAPRLVEPLVPLERLLQWHGDVLQALTMRTLLEVPGHASLNRCQGRAKSLTSPSTGDGKPRQ